MPDNLNISFLIERFQKDLDNIIKKFDDLSKDVRELQIKQAVDGFKTGVSWKMVIAFLIGCVGIIVTIIKTGATK